MLSTFIHDQYSADNTKDLAFALDELFTPCNENGWASSGIYCFWAPETFEILYIGLALDLSQRFRQHNGMIKLSKNACKKLEIIDWFKRHDKLGFSVLVQSSLDQASCKRYNIRFDLTKDEMEKQYGELITAGHEAIVSAEGLLIEVHKKAKNKLPLWNKVGGSILGGKMATVRDVNLLKYFSGELDHWLISRKSIMQLHKNPTFEKWEHYLHAIRSHAMFLQSFKKAWLHFPDQANIKSEILNNKYLPADWIN